MGSKLPDKINAYCHFDQVKAHGPNIKNLRMQKYAVKLFVKF